MYKIVYNGMYEYIIIKIYSKYDTATNTTAFLANALRSIRCKRTE